MRIDSRIDSNAKTIRQMLANTKYTFDYYQREYSWQSRHVTELIDDLTRKFSDDYRELHTSSEVARYGHYFLGSVIVSHNDGQRYIVDGQQRLTTLTLLLIRIRHLLGDDIRGSQIDPLIYSLSFGEEGFNLHVPDREPIMRALYSGESFDTSNESESIRNIAARYNDIENHFELQGQGFQYFVDWLLENVYLVEISTFDARDAYMIFETVNDRGLSLTPADMLRGYLLSHITEPTRRDSASEVWRSRIHDLQQLGRDEVANAIKAWLRSQYAVSVRDFDLIGSEFHRWVRDREETLSLLSSECFADFVERDFDFYSDWYFRLKEASKSFTSVFECVHYNAQHNFTLQFPVLLAPLCVGDSEEESIRKIQVVSRYLDIFIHRCIWNFLSISQNMMVETMFSTMHEIRGKSCSELVELLSSRLRDTAIGFTGSNRFGLYGGNRPKIRLVLARMTDYVETQSSGQPSRFHEYVRRGKNSYEIEHIWANHFEEHLEEFTHEVEFEDYRNRIGGLLLLRKIDNAGFGDLPFTEKREFYRRENLLASSLHERTYERNPGFRRFIVESGLPFGPHAEFMKADLVARQSLYQYLAERIWNPERLTLSYGHEPEPIVIHDSSGGYESNPLVSIDYLWTTVRVRDSIPQEQRDEYERSFPNSVEEFYTRIAELLNLIRENGWELTHKFRGRYCAFYFGNRRIFGVFSGPRFVVWITEEEAERLRNRCAFDRYDSAYKHAVYPKRTTVTQLLPIFEFAYQQIRGLIPSSHNGRI